MKAYACVGSHNKIFFCMVSQNLSKQGRMEIFQDYNLARNNALSENHVREVTITIHRKKKKPHARQPKGE